MWPIHFRCLSLIVFRRLRVSPAITSTSSFDNLSIHLILNMRRHIHISNASSLLQLSFLRVHVSQPYKVTLHTRLFSRRFLREILMLVLSSSRRLRNACLPMAILALTSFALRPSLSNMLPRYLYCLTSSSCFPFKRMFISSLFDLDIFITLVFFSFILMISFHGVIQVVQHEL